MNIANVGNKDSIHSLKGAVCKNLVASSSEVADFNQLNTPDSSGNLIIELRLMNKIYILYIHVKNGHIGCVFT